MLEQIKDKSFKGEWINSKPLNMDDFKGKIVLLKFWTFLCSSCREGIPHVQQWMQDYGEQGFSVISVNSPETPVEKDIDLLKSEVEKLKVNFPVLHDIDTATYKAYGAKDWPSYFLFDKKGNLVNKFEGVIDYKKIEEAIKGLL